jgi:hypothetical protein
MRKWKIILKYKQDVKGGGLKSSSSGKAHLLDMEMNLRVPLREEGISWRLSASLE